MGETQTPARSELLAARVIEARDELGWSNAELARRAGLPRRTIVRITNGGNKARVNPETIERIAAATAKPASFFAVGPESRVAAAAQLLVAALVAELRTTIAEQQLAVDGSELL